MHYRYVRIDDADFQMIVTLGKPDYKQRFSSRFLEQTLATQTQCS